MTDKSLIKRLNYVEKELVHKEKPMKLPFKSRVGKKKQREGWATIVTIEDNKSVDFRKQKIIDGTIKLDKDNLSFHAINPEDVYFYKGKPLIFQPRRKLNPYNPLAGKHETYGQRYIMARMEGDTIKMKKSLGIGASIMGIIVLGVIVYAVMSSGGA